MKIERRQARDRELTSHVGGTRITQEMRDALEAIAEAEGPHLSDVVRGMLEAGIAEYRREEGEWHE